MLMALFLSLLFAGCEKEKIADPPEDPTDKFFPFKITELNFNPVDSTYLGGKISISCISNADSGFVSLNEEIVFPFKGGLFSKEFNLLTNTEFVFTFFKNDSVFRTDHTIKVYEPVVPPLPPTITVTAFPDTIEYGGSSMITVVFDADSVVSNLPGFTGEPGIYPTPSLTWKATYFFTAYNADGGISGANVTVYVLPLYIPTRTDTLCSAPLWAPDSIWFRLSENDPWEYSYPQNNVIYTQAIVFFSNGVYSTYRLPEYTPIGGATWYYVGEDEQYIYWGYEEKHIIELTTNVFIVEYELVGEIVVYVRVKYISVDFP